MASAAQIVANQANAVHSTGPRTEAGKAAVARNRLTHGLSSPAFFILPGEDPAEYLHGTEKTVAMNWRRLSGTQIRRTTLTPSTGALHAAFTTEFQPLTATELFLVDELSRAQWKLQRIAHMEAAVLSRTGDPLTEAFASAPVADALLKLSRYEGAIQRNWYRAHSQLRALRRDAAREQARQAQLRQAEAAQRVTRILEETVGGCSPAPAPPDDSNPVCDSKPMPAHLERELAAHKRRDPLFDPKMDASQLSKELRRWFERS